MNLRVRYPLKACDNHSSDYIVSVFRDNLLVSDSVLETYNLSIAEDILVFLADSAGCGRLGGDDNIVPWPCRRFCADGKRHSLLTPDSGHGK